MPRRDGSGPEGLGALTGRGLGNCDSKKASNVATAIGLGRGLGRGLSRGLGRASGRGLGRGYGFSLEDEKDSLTKRLDQINQMLHKEK